VADCKRCNDGPKKAITKVDATWKVRITSNLLMSGEKYQTDGSWATKWYKKRAEAKGGQDARNPTMNLISIFLKTQGNIGTVRYTGRGTVVT